MAPSSFTASRAPGPGRPTLCTEAFLARLCAAIREDGLSDNAAAAQAGLHRSTMARWKQQHPELELRLEQAREEFRHDKLALIHAGGRGWRAAAWMLERVFPADYHPRALERDRFQKLAQSEISSEPVSQNPPADAVIVAVETLPGVPFLPMSQNSPASPEPPALQPLTSPEPVSQNSAREKHLSRKARRALERAQNRQQRRQAASLSAAAILRNPDQLFENRILAPTPKVPWALVAAAGHRPGEETGARRAIPG